MVMVTIAVLFTTLGWSYILGGLVHWYYGPIDDTPTQDEGIVIREPTTWAGMNTTLERRVEVRNDASLTIRDSNITIMVEDMFLRRAGFNVWEDCSLRLERTRLTLLSDPRINGAVALRGDRHEDIHAGVTSLSRVVNLGQARSPTLELDVCWKVPTHITVAVQRSPTSMMEHYADIAPPSTGALAWHHHTLPISNLSGGIVRLALFREHDAKGYVLVNNIMVLDDGGPLLGDRFGTGSVLWDSTYAAHYADGWYGNPPSFAIELTANYGPMLQIIFSTGDLTLSASSIEVKGVVPLSPQVKDECTKGTYGAGISDERARNIVSVLRGGYIDAFRGSLTIQDCTLDGVPLVACTDGTTLSRSTFKGGTDLVTLARSDAVVEDCRFISEPLPRERRDALFDPYYGGRLLWALSIDGLSGGVGARVQGCEFVGGEIAMDLNMADVDLVDCSFTRVEGIAIWDHETLGGWERVDSSNLFEDCQGSLYLGTATVTLEMRFLGTPYYIPGGERFPMLANEVIKSPPLPEIRVLRVAYREVYIFVPRQMVDANGTSMQIDDISVVLPLGSGALKEINVSAAEPVRTIELTPNDLYPALSMSVGHAMPLGPPTPTDTTGTVEVAVKVDITKTRDPGPRVFFALDGAQEWWVNAATSTEFLPDPERKDYPIYYSHFRAVRKEVPLPEGEHSVRLRYVEFDSVAGDFLERMNATIHVYRLADDGDLTNLSAFIALHDDGWLVIDPGIDVQLGADHAGVSDVRGPVSLNLVLFEGSRVSVGGLAGGRSELRVVSTGPGALDMVDAGLGSLSIDANQSAVTIRNVSCDEAKLTLCGGSCQARDICCTALAVELSGQSSMTMDGADVGGIDGTMACELILRDSVLRLVDATFVSNRAAGEGDDLGTSVLESSSLIVERSRFSGSSLAVVHDGKVHWRLDVVGCTFTSRAVLSVDEASYWTAGGNLKVPGDVTGRIEGNTFVGPASGIVLMAAHANLTVGGNEFRDDARMYAHYRPNYHYVLGDEIRFNYDFVDDGLGFTRGVLGGEATGGSRDVFVDLGGDISGLVTPKSVTVMVISPGNIEPEADAGTMWFARVDPTEKDLVFSVPDWGLCEVRIWHLRNP